MGEIGKQQILKSQFGDERQRFRDCKEYHSKEKDPKNILKLIRKCYTPHMRELWGFEKGVFYLNIFFANIIPIPSFTLFVQREGFVKCAESKAVQNFLEWFSETSIFNEFMEMHLKSSQRHGKTMKKEFERKNSGCWLRVMVSDFCVGLFQQRVMEQSEQSQNHTSLMTSATPLSFKNAKLFMRGSRPFGHWFKEAFVLK